MRKNLIPTDQIAGLINSVHSTLSDLGNEVAEVSLCVPAVAADARFIPTTSFVLNSAIGQNAQTAFTVRAGLSVGQYRVRWKLASDFDDSF